MNENKITFILCTNHDGYFQECQLYIQQLTIPDGFTVDILPVRDAHSMAEGYNRAMAQSDARYKIYLHQDVFILNKNFLRDTVAIFQADPRIGMIGMVGTKRLPENGCMWSTPMRTGALRTCTLNTSDDYFDLPISPRKGYAPVQAIDGLLMMTQTDITWRSDLFTGWDFYDASQSLEISRAGRRIVVPFQETPWVLHDCGYMNLKDYHRYRKIFLETYDPGQTDHIQDCEQRIRHPKKEPATEHIVNSLLSLLEQGQFEEAYAFASSSLSTTPKCQENETFCILAILLQIYQEEKALGTTQIFHPLQDHPASWLIEHYTKIKHYLWREKYNLPEEAILEGKRYFQKMLVSDVAQRVVYTYC